MMIYGGHSAYLRGEPFPRLARDIDVFGTASDLDALLMHLRSVMPSHVSVIPWDMHPERLVVRHPSLIAPAWWRTIEFETVSPEFLALAESLPGSAPADIGGFACRRSGQQTDFLIKQAAIEVVSDVNPKHAADLEHFGWSLPALSGAELQFFNQFRASLVARYYEGGDK